MAQPSRIEHCRICLDPFEWIPLVDDTYGEKHEDKALLHKQEQRAPAGYEDYNRVLPQLNEASCESLPEARRIEDEDYYYRLPPIFDSTATAQENRLTKEQDDAMSDGEIATEGERADIVEENGVDTAERAKIMEEAISTFSSSPESSSASSKRSGSDPSALSSRSSSTTGAAAAGAPALDTNTRPLILGCSLPCDPDHLFCSACLEKYIDTQLDNGIWPILCPQESCQERILAEVVESLLGPKASRWHALGLEKAVKRQVYCPNKACNIMIDGGSGSDDDEDRGWQVEAVCPYCGHRFCGLCLKKAHKGKTCDELKNHSVTDRLFDALARNMAWKRCPSCGQTVEKTEGCHHMTCRCGREFCYVCPSGLWPCKHSHAEMRVVQEEYGEEEEEEGEDNEEDGQDGWGR